MITRCPSSQPVDKRCRASWIVWRWALALGTCAISQRVSAQIDAPAAVLAAVAGEPTATISGTVANSSDQQGLPYASVVIAEPRSVGAAVDLSERFADSAGAFRISGLVPGIYVVRAREIGYAPIDTMITIESGVTTLRLGLVQVPHMLPRVVVAGTRAATCVRTGLPDSATSPELVNVFRALMTNVDRFRLLRRVYPFRYAVERKRVEVSGEKRRVQDVDTIAVDSRRWRTYVPGHLFTYFVQSGNVGEQVYVPSVQDLGDSAFMATHCYEYGGPEVVGSDTTIRVDFRPESKLSRPDFDGSIYLDAVRGFVRRAVFHLTHGDQAIPQILQLTVTTTFREIAPNVQVFDRVESDQWIRSTGEVRDVETQQFLSYSFEHGAPGQGTVTP